MGKKYILYFDDTGSRDPDKSFTAGIRRDKMDCFALGGILIKEEDIDAFLQAHKAFCSEWDIDYHLHSSRIRGGQGKFGWLKRPENAGLFLPALQEFLLSLPIVGIACVIDRPGYVARYKDRYDDRLWFMCKTAFGILAERAAKFAYEGGRKLEIFFEQAGRKEDRDIVQYVRSLKREGNPFNRDTSEGYAPFTAEQYRNIILGEPRRKTKAVPMIQIADLVLYPMAKGGYNSGYHPYGKLKEAGKLIDCLLPAEKVSLQGIKYSCFDTLKN